MMGDHAARLDCANRLKQRVAGGEKCRFVCGPDLCAQLAGDSSCRSLAVSFDGTLAIIIRHSGRKPCTAQLMGENRDRPPRHFNGDDSCGTVAVSSLAARFSNRSDSRFRGHARRTCKCRRRHADSFCTDVQR